ncbi:hypothetical protein ACGF5T_33080 [Streptomyces sp. NPDC047853]|uniref:hypothetical protein n=1 Tax=unclassified Streptomyces TaxID=2593676 RepID=UPI0034559BF6
MRTSLCARDTFEEAQGDGSSDVGIPWAGGQRFRLGGADHVQTGVGFLALFGLGWRLLATSAFDGVARLVEVVAAGCAVTVGRRFAARRYLISSAGGPFPAGRHRRFHQVNGLQWLLIVAIAVVCGPRDPGTHPRWSRLSSGSLSFRSQRGSSSPDCE